MPTVPRRYGRSFSSSRIVIAGPAFAVAARIAALDDEVGHDPVNAEAVEEALARERDEVLDRQRRVEHRQLDLDGSAIGVEIRLAVDTGGVRDAGAS